MSVYLSFSRRSTPTDAPVYSGLINYFQVTKIIKATVLTNASWRWLGGGWGGGGVGGGGWGALSSSFCLAV